MPLHKEYRRLWETEGYDPRMGSAGVVHPPGLQKLRVYYFTSAEYAISNIALGRVKVSRFSELNDPFELLALKSSRSSVRNISKLLRDEYDKTSGLISFSKDWISPPMWSHYGSTHRGICLGFNLQRKSVLDVIYENERVSDRLPHLAGEEVILDTLRKKLSRIKSGHWEYESEARLVFPLESAIKEGSLYFKPLGPDLELAEVILGAFCELPLSGIRRLVSSLHPGVATYRARLAWKSFSVVPIESTIDAELDAEVARKPPKSKPRSLAAIKIRARNQGKGNLWIEIDGERFLFVDCLNLGHERVSDDNHLYLLKYQGRCLRLEDGRGAWLTDEEAIALANELGCDPMDTIDDPFEPAPMQ